MSTYTVHIHTSIMAQTSSNKHRTEFQILKSVLLLLLEQTLTVFVGLLTMRFELVFLLLTFSIFHSFSLLRDITAGSNQMQRLSFLASFPFSLFLFVFLLTLYIAYFPISLSNLRLIRSREKGIRRQNDLVVVISLFVMWVVGK